MWQRWRDDGLRTPQASISTTSHTSTAQMHVSHTRSVACWCSAAFGTFCSLLFAVHLAHVWAVCLSKGLKAAGTLQARTHKVTPLLLTPRDRRVHSRPKQQLVGLARARECMERARTRPMCPAGLPVSTSKCFAKSACTERYVQKSTQTPHT